MLASNNKSVKQGKNINHINSLAPTSHNIGNHLIMSSSAGRLMHCKFCILASCTLQHLKTENLDLGHCQELKKFRQSTMAPLLVENSYKFAACLSKARYECLRKFIKIMDGWRMERGGWIGGCSPRGGGVEGGGGRS